MKGFKPCMKMAHGGKVRHFVEGGLSNKMGPPDDDEKKPVGWGTGRAGKREKQFKEWMKNEDVDKASEMGVGERIKKGAKIAGKALIEPFGTQTARIADSLGLKKGGKVRRYAEGSEGGVKKEVTTTKPEMDYEGYKKLMKNKPIPAQPLSEDAFKSMKKAGFDFESGSFKKAKGGKVQKVMHEFKSGQLHSGSKKGPVVKSRKQAIAIALSEAGKSKKG